MKQRKRRKESVRNYFGERMEFIDERIHKMPLDDFAAG